MNQPLYTPLFGIHLALFYIELVLGNKPYSEAHTDLIEQLSDFNARLMSPLPFGEYQRLLDTIDEAEAPFHCGPSVDDECVRLRDKIVEAQVLKARAGNRDQRGSRNRLAGCEAKAETEQQKLPTTGPSAGQGFPTQRNCLQDASMACRAQGGRFGTGQAGPTKKKWLRPDRVFRICCRSPPRCSSTQNFRS